MIAANLVPEQGYYNDSHSEKAREYILRELGSSADAEIHFTPGGTLTNVIAISAFLRPHQAVIASKDSHIYVHETGAIEASGHKVIAVDTPDGKLTPELLEPVFEEHETEHMVKPGMVSISNATEIGSVYSKSELTRLRGYCRERGLILYCDGARLGSALTAKNNDLTMADMAELTDAFYIGGTKNGALMGEALVISRPELRTDFRYIAKQKGGLLAKGAIVGIQFEELFKDELFYRLARRENMLAGRISEAFAAKGYSFLCPSQSNQVFPILPLAEIEALEAKFSFLRWKKVKSGEYAVRFTTSWATSEEAVEALISAL